ncbi:MAG TPA: 3-dehydroquinate synthase [Candidatus Saccharicenans sp.]|nr:3-dehydroquinate synthase [Candidatus Saccharicenans sp.]
MSEKIDFCGETGKCQILINESISQLSNYLLGREKIIVTDDNVNRLYSRLFPPARDVIILQPGEGTKTLLTVESIYKRLLLASADRSTFILGMGGGVVSDVTGFVSSTFMRGLKFGFVPTTLLAQVDAAIGGKNGVNLDGFKNMIGVVNQPDFVLIDFSFLKTLPAKELANGFSEIIKCASIASHDLFELLEEESKRALQLDEDLLRKIITETIRIKTAIVSLDEKDRGQRKKLNFGHTFAHALEKAYRITHGEAVSLGMILAANLSVKKNMLTEAEALRIRKLLQKFNLPVSMKFDRNKILVPVHQDKKKSGQMIDFVLLRSLGQASIERLTFSEVEEAIDDLCES